MLRTLAIANQKGGVGKTTTAINLAACLAEKKYRVLLIDLDPQANATSGLGLEKATGGSVYQALLAEPNDLEAPNLRGLIQRSPLENLDVIPSELDLAAAEVDVARTENYLQRFALALAPLKASAESPESPATNYDFILVDCPPSLGILTMNALAAVDRVLIPLQCEYYALEGLSVMLRLIEQLRTSGANPDLELTGIVMTMVDARTNLAAQVLADVQAHFPDKIFASVIPRTVRLAEAPSFGKPIILYDPQSTATTAYRALASELLQRLGVSVVAPSTTTTIIPLPNAGPPLSAATE